MRDVASTAGVSLKTVSRVVNGEPGVRARHRGTRRVRRSRELGFARNDVARSLRHGRAGALGLVIEDVANPFYSAIARAVEDAAHDRGHIAHHGVLRGGPRARARARPAPAAPLGRRAADRPRRRRPPLPAGRASAPARRSSSSTARRAASRPTPSCSTTSAARAPRSPHLSRTGHRADRLRRRRAAAVHRAPSASRGYREALARGRPGGPTTRCVRLGTARRRQRRGRGARAARAARRRAGRPRSSRANNRNTIGAAARAARPRAPPVALVGFDDFELADMLAAPGHGRARTRPRTWAASAPSWPTGAWTATTGRRSGGSSPCELVARGSGEVRRREAAVLLPPNGMPRFYRGGPAIAALRGTRARRRPRARGLGRLDDDGLRRARRSGLSRLPDGTPAARRRRRRPRRPASAPSTSPAAAPTRRCWSSCWTPASACPSTSTPTARSPREHLGLALRQDRGVDRRRRASPAPSVARRLPRGRRARDACAAGCATRTTPRCSARCTRSPVERRRRDLRPRRHAARDRRRAC